MGSKAHAPGARRRRARARISRRASPTASTRRSLAAGRSTWPALPRRHRARSTTRRSSAGCASRVERLKQVLEPAGAAALAARPVGRDPDARRRSAVASSCPAATSRSTGSASSWPPPRRCRRPPDGRRADRWTTEARPRDRRPSLRRRPSPGVSRSTYGAPFVGPLLPPPSPLAPAAAARAAGFGGGARDPRSGSGAMVGQRARPRCSRSRRRPPPAVVLHRVHRARHARRRSR